jgi:hypothetical protein
MTPVSCPDCGSDSLRVVHRPHFYVECQHGDCFWTQRPDADLVIAAALETRRRNQPPVEDVPEPSDLDLMGRFERFTP